MKYLFPLFLIANISFGQWTRETSFDSDLARLTSSADRLIAYSRNEISTSSDGVTWSEPIDPGFPIVAISETSTGDFVALSFIPSSIQRGEGENHNVLILDSSDGVSWTERFQIGLAIGLDPLTSGEIVATENTFFLTATGESDLSRETFSLYQVDPSAGIEYSSFEHSNVLLVNGKLAGERPAFVNVRCRFTDMTSLSDEEGETLWWRPLSGYLDLRVASDDLLIGQNGFTRFGGEITYGNWATLGEIKGFHNGVGLVMEESGNNPKLHLSNDFLRSWTEQEFPAPEPERFLDAAFFKDQWIVLAEEDSQSTIYSLSVPPVSYLSQGAAEVTVEAYQDRPFEIPGCREGLVTSEGIEISLPNEADQLFQVYTSRDLETWTAYDLPLPGATTHNFPIPPDSSGLEKIFFRAEKISVLSPE